MSILRLTDRAEARDSGVDSNRYVLRMTESGRAWLSRNLSTWHMEAGGTLSALIRVRNLFGFHIVTDNDLCLEREWLLTTEDGRIVHRGEFEACHCGRAVYEWFPDRTSNGLCPECSFMMCDNDSRICGFKHGMYE